MLAANMTIKIVNPRPKPTARDLIFDDTITLSNFTSILPFKRHPLNRDLVPSLIYSTH